MKTYTATFWRSNPQLAKGGYETKRTIEAETKREAMRKAQKIEKGTLYGSMTLQALTEA